MISAQQRAGPLSVRQFHVTTPRPFAATVHRSADEIKRSEPSSTFDPDTSKMKKRAEPDRSVNSAISEHDPQATGGQEEVQEEINEEEDEDIESTTGVIEHEEREGLLYYDHIYPAIARFRPLQQLTDKLLMFDRKHTLDRIVKYSIPEDCKITITGFVPRKRDGGAFVAFKVDDKNVSLTEVEKAIFKKTTKSAHRPWFDPLSTMRTFKVKGVPWIEDLRRYTTNKVKVVFEGGDLSQETLYTMLRRYGPIHDIEPPPPGMKDTPRYAMVTFSRFSDAPTARNCVNGQVVNGTKVHLFFEQLEHKNILRSWLVDHPRIVVPIVLALLAGLAVIIFDPIRVWFVKKKIEGWSLHAYSGMMYYFRKVFQSAATFLNRSLGYNYRSLVFNKDESSNMWEDRVKNIADIKQWVNEGAGTYIIVQGPRGSGKQDLVMSHALKDCRKILTIDCEVLVKSRTDPQFIRHASNEIGYYPVFPFMNSLATFLDLGVQGLTGQKSGFAESTESQFKSMLSTAITAIYETAVAHKPDGIPSEVYLQQHPEAKPVIVIKHFMAKSDNYEFVNRHISEWTANLIQGNLAHVIFISDDISYEKVLSVDLPNQVFKTVVLGDATASSAKSYIMRQLSKSSRSETDDTLVDREKTQEIPLNLEGLDEALRPIGGRMTDIQAFARRLRSGELPLSAVKDMIHQSSIEILQRYLMKPTDEWTREQVWSIIKIMAQRDTKEQKSKQKSHQFDTQVGKSVSIGVLNSDPNFKSIQDQQRVLRALESSEMICTEGVGGRIISMKAGKPLYQAAFEHLLQDKSLNAWMECQILSNCISKEESKIRTFEQELMDLAKLPSKWEIKTRINYLSDKLYASQIKVQGLERSLAEQQKILTTSV